MLHLAILIEQDHRRQLTQLTVKMPARKALLHRAGANLLPQTEINQNFGHANANAKLLHIFEKF
jgi:hypothetical protein